MSTLSPRSRSELLRLRGLGLSEVHGLRAFDDVIEYSANTVGLAREVDVEIMSAYSLGGGGPSSSAKQGVSELGSGCSRDGQTVKTALLTAVSLRGGGGTKAARIVADTGGSARGWERDHR